jgi:hypothetical protein
MKLTYEIIETESLSGTQKIILRSDGLFIPFAEDNADYQAYLNKDKAEQSTPILPE